MSDQKIWATLYHRQTKSKAYGNVHPRIRRYNASMFTEVMPSIEDQWISNYWETNPVIGKISDDSFFEHIRHGWFPVNTYLRNELELDYLPLRDKWHDMFGHLGILRFEKYANYLRTLAHLWWLVEGQPHEQSVRERISKLYWLTSEFGMIEANGELYAYGAGIISSVNELEYAVSSDRPTRRRLGTDSKQCWEFIKDELPTIKPEYEQFQPYYLTISSFDVLPELARQLLPLI